MIRLAALGGLLIALIGAGIWLHQSGRADHEAEVEAENAKAVGQAIQADLGRRECVDAGGVFQFDTGKCARPEPSHR
ncbi:hypothetical protein [Pacificoceanicola onchidii]|uniref:hypothetical protein n=1 Tax=Pacificoceanicola onchidii TaxID=2562685 RepID=UPI0014562475|nr:hypothetical protein [Pacificoceanicola onchidii]